MKKYTLAAAAALAMASAAFAAPLNCITDFPFGDAASGQGGVMLPFGANAGTLSGTGSGAGCVIGDKRYYGFSSANAGVFNGVNYGTAPDTVRVSAILQPGNTYTLSTTGNLENAFAFQYYVEVSPLTSPNVIRTLGGDISVVNGSDATTLTKVGTAYDANGNILGASVTINASGGTAAPSPTALPAGTKVVLIQDYYNPGGGAATNFNNSVQQGTVPEPATMGFIGLGLAAIGFFGARRRRA